MRSLTFSCVVFTIGEIIWQKIPAEPLKYQHKHAVDWYFIERISKACINFTPKERPTIEEVVAMIGNEPTASSVQIHLKNSQRPWRSSTMKWQGLLQRTGSLMQ